MKKSFYLLLFLFTGIYCFSQDIEKLPAKPWKELVEVNANKKDPLLRWDTNINISIEGIYHTSDSLTIASIIKKLDRLTETIHIRFSNPDNSNFKIKFLNKYIQSESNPEGIISSSVRTNNNRFETIELHIYIIERTDLEIKSALENQIAQMLVDGSFASPAAFEKRKSIFNPVRGSTLTGSLNSGDISIIKEVYKKGFEKRLEKAEQQFKNIPKKLENDKVRKRALSLWWVKNPIAVLFLPTLFLLLLFLFFIKKIKVLMVSKIKNDWIGFGLISLIALLFLAILIIFSVSFHDFLTIPDDYQKVNIIRNDTIITTIISLVVLFPFLFLFRFIELKIQKSSQNIFVKTGLVFLSTGLIPFTCILMIFLFAKDIADTDESYLTLSRVFLCAMTIASIRAFIGYFIFKERSLIVENEMKLSNLRELTANAKLKSLQSQINPHFLYNSLNSIASLAHVDAKKTQKMAYSLSDLFKYSINRKGEKVSAIKDEIDMVKTYLEIEKIRFGDRLEFIVKVDKQLENHKVPMFLMQPLVENAVKHGISQNEGKGKVVLKIEKENNNIIISVYDNGPDFPEGLLSGHGLQTVYDLLRLSYADKASLNWTNAPEKMITITIPETL